MLLVLSCSKEPSRNIARIDSAVPSPSVPAVASSATPTKKRRLYVTDGPVSVHAGPRRTTPALGVVRAGGVLELVGSSLAQEPDCEAGWQAVEPRGFVCPSPGMKSDESDPIVRAWADYHLAYDAALPAHYGFAGETPVYLRIPDEEEQLRSEPTRRGWNSSFSGEGTPDVPEALRSGLLAPRSPKPITPGSPITGLLLDNSKVSWIAEFTASGRGWLLTPDWLFVPADRVRPAIVSGFHGIELTDIVGIAFSGARPAHQYTRSSEDRHFVLKPETWPPSTPIVLSVPANRYSEEKFLETTEPETFVRTDEVIVVHATPPTQWGLDPKDQWIEVDAKKNVLLLREGHAVRLATLVSASRLGALAARGRYRISAKHVSLAAPLDKPRVRTLAAEIPTVLVALDANDEIAVALYAAWWQKTWGVPNNLPGVALSAIDAKRVFDRIEPALPEGWHSVFGEGTWIVVHD